MNLGIHPSARKHGLGDIDIRHAVKNAMSIDDQEDDLRLYLGAGRDGTLIEVVTVLRSARVEVAIHAMKMRPKYGPFLSGGS
jgi:hypothetical protein